MTKRKKMIIAAAAVLAAAFMAAAGIYFYVNRFDPQRYVKAVLDMSYKNQAEEYLEMADISEEEAKAVFENNLDITMEEFQSAAMTEDLKEKYRELFGEIAKQVNYTVGEPEKEGDGSYLVPVKVKPVSLFEDTYEEFQTKAQEYADQVTDSVMKGEEMPSDEEMQSKVYEIYYEVLKENLDKGLLYGEAQDVTLHVGQNDSGEYEINEEDMENLDALLIAPVTAK